MRPYWWSAQASELEVRPYRGTAPGVELLMRVFWRTAPGAGLLKRLFWRPRLCAVSKEAIIYIIAVVRPGAWVTL